MKLNVTFDHFKEINKKGYSLDIIFLLKLVKEDVDIKSLYENNIKLDVLLLTCLTKQLLTSDYKLTLSGNELINFMDSKLNSDAKLSRKKNIDDEFTKWWNTFPGTDTFIYKERKFSGTRSLRTAKDDCKVQLYKILDEGNYSIEELISALKYEVEQKKENSYKTGINKLTYMQNSLTYLRQRTFESYIELIKEGIEQEKTIIGATDI